MVNQPDDSKTAVRHDLPDGWDKIVPWVESQTSWDPEEKLQLLRAFQPLIQAYAQSDGRIKMLERQFREIQINMLRVTGGLSATGTIVESLSAKLLDLLIRDPMTRLFNGEGFRRRVQEFYEMERRSSISAILILDVNRFKKINDTFGHQMGDWAIKRVAKILRMATRSRARPGKRLSRYDIVAHIGGDEFAVFLPNLKHRRDAFKVARRISRAFAQVRWAKEYKEWARGWAELPKHKKNKFRMASLAIGVVILDVHPVRSAHQRAVYGRHITHEGISIADKLSYRSKNTEHRTGKPLIFARGKEFKEGRFRDIPLSFRGDFVETVDPGL